MASLSLPIPAEEGTPVSRSRTAADDGVSDAVVVAGFGDPILADYAAYVSCRQSRMTHRSHRRNGTAGGALVSPPMLLDLSGSTASADLQQTFTRTWSALILFLKPSLSDAERGLVHDLLTHAAKHAKFVGFISSFRVHLGDGDATASEAYALEQAQRLGMSATVFRAGHILSRKSRVSSRLRKWSFCYPLIPQRLRSCFVTGAELFDAIEAERCLPQPVRGKVIVLLGPNRPWRMLLYEHCEGWWARCLALVSAVLALFLVGQLMGVLLDFLARRRPALRRWNFDTLQPRSLRELLALYNKYNYPYVKVVGYNNGVVHFGHRYPSKTIVSTVHCNRVVWAGPDAIKADCGATIRTARTFLAEAGMDLCVVPNYSYVCLGTGFFVPIHGSAAECSTIADSITKAILYDPVRDRIIIARRLEPAFADYVFNLTPDVVLLRLVVRAKARSRYVVDCQEVENPGSDELVNALRDEGATNVEIRKADAAGTRVKVFKYHAAKGAPAGLELPRDSLGSLWDRLEENRVTSFLMHALTRHFAWHVELFFTAAEFATFWQSHQTLPLRKIQLRYVRRDGFPHSPFCDHDCIAADMFVLRRHRRRLENYLQTTFAVVRSNPGKHSR